MHSEAPCLVSPFRNGFLACTHVVLPSCMAPLACTSYNIHMAPAPFLLFPAHTIERNMAFAIAPLLTTTHACPSSHTHPRPPDHLQEFEFKLNRLSLHDDPVLAAAFAAAQRTALLEIPTGDEMMQGLCGWSGC